ncbi:MAG: ABC transporter ATP-binding protein [Aerococcus sp.]|nr:ABC transporter ATP-binding protein [Aerococcus sp.]
MTQEQTHGTYAIEMQGISKRFGNKYANKNIDLAVKKGEIHALLGENGAGKSTLMNILSGLLAPTTGTIHINGKPVSMKSAQEAQALGIGMVHQHFMLIDDFTVTENIMLGSEMTKGGLLDRQSSSEMITKLSEQYHLQVDPKLKVRDISVGMQQRAEILKVLYRGADILILDEPTAVLTPQEINELMQTLRHLADDGKTILLITHKLKEIKAVADRCTIIRAGEKIQTVNVSETDEGELARLMVGRPVDLHVAKPTGTKTHPILEVKDLVVHDSRKLPAVNGVSFTLNGGEILGLAGVDGNGQGHLIETIAGMRTPESGSITINGKDISYCNPKQVLDEGIGYIPEDRQKEGLTLPLSVAENLVLKTYNKAPYSEKGWLHPGAIKEHAMEMIKNYDIRGAEPETPAASLSGGNQQKVIFARELSLNPEVLIAAQPTRGLDVGAVEGVYHELVNERNKGRAILLMSLELDEILALSDRIAVISRGKLSAIVDPKTTNEEELGLLMAGVPYEQVKQRKEMI